MYNVVEASWTEQIKYIYEANVPLFKFVIYSKIILGNSMYHIRVSWGQYYKFGVNPHFSYFYGYNHIDK